MPFWRQIEQDERAKRLEKLTRIYARLAPQGPEGGSGKEVHTESDASSFELSLERRARRLGTTAEALLADYARRISNSPYPTPNCLRPDELQEFSVGRDLPPELNAHVEDCEGCRSLLKSAQISDGRLKELLTNARRLAAQESTDRSAARGSGAWLASHAKNLSTVFAESLSLLGRSMPRWVPVTSALLLAFGFMYPTMDPYFKRSGSYITEKVRGVNEWNERNQKQAEREQELARQKMAVNLGLYQLAGTLPEDPAKMKKPVDLVMTASAQGMFDHPETIAAWRQNLKRKAATATPKNRERWLGYTSDLAGAETLARYEALRTAGASDTVSVQGLEVKDLFVRDGIPTIVVGSDKVKDDTRVRELMQESFDQTKGIQSLNIYQGDSLIFNFRRPKD